MTRAAFLGSISLTFLACATLPACGQQDETQAVLAQCSDPAPRDIDTCLERARVQDETDPSPEIHALVGHLIQRQVKASEATHAPDQSDSSTPPPPDDQGVSSYDASPPTPPPPSDAVPLEPYQPPPPDNARQDAPPDAQGDPSDAEPPDADGPPAQLPNTNSPSSAPPQGGGPGPGA